MSRKFDFLATGVGSLPFRDATEACALIFQHMPEVPHCPQLPRANAIKGMIEQFAEGMPGVASENDRVFVRPFEPYDEWERFYTRYEEADLDYFSISPERAQGLHAFLDELPRRTTPRYVKGQVTGPITLGLALKDESGAAIFFNQDLQDMLVKLVGMKARWQAMMFQRALPDVETLVFIDEPTLSSYGSAFMNVSREAVVTALRQVIEQVPGLRGVHICGNTDWSMVMEIGLDVIDFDAYNYLSSFVIYPSELKKYLEGGGGIGWGIVPTDEEALREADSSQLAQRVKEAMDGLVRDGVAQELLRANSIITPTCGAASLSEAAARKAYQLTAEIAGILRADLAG